MLYVNDSKKVNATRIVFIGYLQNLGELKICFLNVFNELLIIKIISPLNSDVKIVCVSFNSLAYVLRRW